MTDRSLLAAYRSARADQARAEQALLHAQARAGMRPAAVNRGLRLAAVLCVVTGVAAVVAVVLWARADDGYSDADYLTAATDRVELLLSPDYRKPKQSQRILAGATGRFYDEFAQSADAYSKFVADAGTVSAGRVTGAGVDKRLGDDAEVLVAATADLDATAQRPASARQFRLRVIVTPENGILKLSMVQYLP